MKVPLLDLKAQYATVREEVERAVAAVFDEQHFVLGPIVSRFEREMEAYTGARHAIGVASGSDALLLALQALEIGPGDTVVTSPFTFFAPAGAVARVGATLRFADIDPETFNLDPEGVARVLDATTTGRRVILPVHLYGRLAAMDELARAAERFDAVLVEDAAQAVGAREKTGRRRMAGTIGRLGALSFFPSKNLGGAGDGGMVLTDDDGLAERLRMLRVHGAGSHRYLHERIGLNSRLDALQAAVLSVKLRRLDDWNARRRERAARYALRFEEAGLTPGKVRTPEISGEDHVVHQYVIRAEKRDALREALGRANVETQIYYPLALHQQPCFATLGYRNGDFPVCERATTECVALPIYPELRDEQIDHVVASAHAFYRAAG